MRRHPAEIAQEIIKFPFFQSFDESLLMQVSTMVHEVKFNAGSTLIEAGQISDRIYFLRSGTLLVIVGGEKITEIREAGEVIGEMSVQARTPAIAEIRTQTDCECFMIATDDFASVNPSQKDRLQYLLYKIYSGLLISRLSKTNETAKLYEITARELQEKKRELEILTNAQMSFMRGENKNRKTVLLIEPNKKQQNIIKTAVGGAGVNVRIANSEDEAKMILAEKPDIIFADEGMSSLLKYAFENDYRGEMILLANQKINFSNIYSLPFISNILSRNVEDKAETVINVLRTLTKILHKDFFGPEKYLAWGTEFKTQKITSSKERQQIKDEMQANLKKLGVRSAMLDRMLVSAEELMMNAIYDAPTDKEGTPLFIHLPRASEVRLLPEQQPDFTYGCDGNTVSISIRDPFGRLTKEMILKHLESCYNNQAGIHNEGKGGAGRGLHQIIESSDTTIFNVKANESTEVICLFEIDKKNDGSPDFQIFIHA